MDQFHVALIAPYGIESSGIRHLSAYLRERGHRVSIIFLKYWSNQGVAPPTKKELDALVSHLRSLAPSLVGIGFVSSYFPVLKPLIRRVRDEVSAPLILGGVHPTAEPEKCLAEADLICVGEGEGALLDIVERMRNGEPVRTVPNIWTRTNGRTVANPLRPPIADLDSLPFRDFGGEHIFEIAGNRLRQRDPMLDLAEFRVYTSRGCPFHCGYCYNDVVARRYQGLGPLYRQRSVTHVIGELRLAMERFKRIREVVFDDDVFLPGREWLEEFLDVYPREVGLPFRCMLHPDHVDRDTLRRLKQAGLRRVLVGVQTGSPRESTEIFLRNLDSQKVIDFGEACRETKIDAAYDFILDNPLATEADKRQTIQLVLDLPRPFVLFLYSLSAFPGTALTDVLLDRGIITQDEVEGECSKATVQHRATLSYPRPAFDAFVIAMLTLASKSFLPQMLLRWIYRRTFFGRHPRPLLIFAYTCNLAKIAGIAIKLLVRGEMTLFRIRQHWNPRTMLIQ